MYKEVLLEYFIKIILIKDNKDMNTLTTKSAFEWLGF